MFLQFKFANFRSYADETVFDMTATPIKEHRSSLIQKNGQNILPVAAVYGANASGKSSFFMALERMRSVVINRLFYSDPIPEYKTFSIPFLFDDEVNKSPTEYEVSVLLDNYEYRYGFSCFKDKILTEYLYKKKFSKNHTVEKMVFERQGMNVISGEGATQNLKKEIDYCASMATEQSLILTDVGQRNKNNNITLLYLWFKVLNVISNKEQQIMTMGSNEEKFIGQLLADDTVSEEIKNEFKNLVREIDPSIKDLTYVPEKDEEGNTIFIAKTMHDFNGKIEKVSLSIESEGTKKFIFLISFIIFALKKDIALFIDELDSQLHPLILRRIVQLYTNKQTNPKGAQLVFSAHNLINLDSSDLRRDEIWFVEKNNQKSTMYSLVDFEDGGIRSDLSFGKHYLLGRFGAVPFQEEE